MNQIRCYICGDELHKEFMLVPVQDGTDRVFVVHVECSRQIEADMRDSLIKVQRK